MQGLQVTISEEQCVFFFKCDYYDFFIFQSDSTNNKKQNNLPKGQKKAPNLYWVYEYKVAFDWEIWISDFAI